MISSDLLSNKKLSELKGIGVKTEKLFARIGVDDLDKLLCYYPRSYDLYGPLAKIDDFKAGEKYAAEFTVTKPASVIRGSRATLTVLQVEQDFRRIEIVWYNQPYLRGKFKKGSRFVFRGLVIKKSGKWVMQHPSVYSPAEYEQIAGSIRPIYPITAGLSNNAVIKAVSAVLQMTEITDPLPEDIIREYELMPRSRAVHNVHFPENERLLRAARSRIIFDEFLFYMLRLFNIGKNRGESESRFVLNDFSEADALIGKLPYSLTKAQIKVWNEIKAALSSGKRMNMLLQGDVGSGKTIIAFLALISAFKAGCQCAFMAPTEVLASQHYKNLCRLDEEYMLGIRPVLLVGSLSAKEKSCIQDDICLGRAGIVIGTHALIQEKVNFSDLALVIIDEQHRFGVAQRLEAANKGSLPHVCVMSATPIPRTLALMLYGDLDVSVLDEMPAERKRTLNAAVDTSYREKAYNFILKEIKKGHQAYVVCPMIEKNEELGCESVIEYTERLKKIFGGDARIDMLHGRMNSYAKESALSKFAEGLTDILVCTTVVEVGVDVPNATVMMVENADRFGLAALHQLRGRIGRGDAQSYCIFVASEGKDADNERLKVLTKSNDGFYIAEEDLKLRGQGDLFGFRQSGLPGFNMADPFEDREILRMASEAARDIIERNDLSAKKLVETAMKSAVIDADTAL